MARGNSRWTEIDNDLVERRPYLVSASTDELYRPHRGAVFADDSLVEQMAPLCFVVTPEGELEFYERVGHPKTYTELLERKAKRRR